MLITNKEKEKRNGKSPVRMFQRVSVVQVKALIPRRLVTMTSRQILVVLITLCTFGVWRIQAASKNIPKWKKQACEAPATQNESSHYVCDDNGDMQCLPGWIGDLCDVPICKKGCDPIQGYCKRPNECRCKMGFYGDTCNKCITLPGCQHGYCNNSFECKCYEGWDGIFCSEPVCHEDCHPSKGYCDWPGECRCRLGWTGELCKECQTLPGCVHGTCAKPLECKCEKGWQGILCHLPVCSDGCHRDRGYCRKPNECRCKVGWVGKNCTQCFPYPGCVHGTCNRPWECNCKSGWGGMLCDQELKYCETHNVTCHNGATCVSLPEEDGNYRCLCADGYIGRNCEVDKKKVEIVGLMPPKPSLMLLKSTTTAPSTASEDLLLESDDEYEEETTKPNSSIPSLVNENETLNETI